MAEDVFDTVALGVDVVMNIFCAIVMIALFPIWGPMLGILWLLGRITRPR